MATSPDESDYGYDLTAEEEDLVSSLVANFSSSASPAPQASTRSSTPAADDQGPFGSLHSDDLDFDPSELEPARGLQRSPDACEPRSGEPATASGNRKFTPYAARRDKQLASFVARTTAKSRPMALDVVVAAHGQPASVSYPDLSRALSHPPDESTPENEHDRILADLAVDVDKNQDDVPPILRFRTFPRKPFSVSDLTAGAWCEQQYYYTLTRSPFGRKTRTAAMRGGTRVHQNLEDQIYTTVPVTVEIKEDAFGLKLWNIIQGLRTLRDTGLTRELEVWGMLGDEGYVVNGVIDGLSHHHPDPDFVEGTVGGKEGSSKTPLQHRKITDFFPSCSQPDKSKPSIEDDDDTRRVYIIDVKTRASLQRPGKVQERVTKVQLSFYHRFLADMAADRLDYDAVFRRYGLRPDECFSDHFLAQMAGLHEHEDDLCSASSSPPDLVRYHSLSSLVPLLKNELRLTFPRGAESLGRVVSVEYRYRTRADPDPDDNSDEPESGAFICATSFLVDDEVLRRYVDHELEWWRGERKPEGVSISEAFKCRTCEFTEGCEWRTSRERELVGAARSKRAGRGT